MRFDSCPVNALVLISGLGCFLFGSSILPLCRFIRVSFIPSRPPTQSLQIDYTLSPAVHMNAYHIPIVRSQLTRALPTLFPDLRDEIVCAFRDEIPESSGESVPVFLLRVPPPARWCRGTFSHARVDWTSVRIMDAMMEIVCRTSNRLFVGLPLCECPGVCFGSRLVGCSWRGSFFALLLSSYGYRFVSHTIPRWNSTHRRIPRLKSYRANHTTSHCRPRLRLLRAQQTIHARCLLWRGYY